MSGYDYLAKALFDPRGTTRGLLRTSTRMTKRIWERDVPTDPKGWGEVGGQSAKTADWLSGNDVMSMFSRNCGCAKLRSSSVRRSNQLDVDQNFNTSKVNECCLGE